MMHQQHRDSFPSYYTAHTGGIPRHFYQRFPLLAEQAKWAYGDRTSDNHIPSNARPSLGETNKSSKNGTAPKDHGHRRHSKAQRRAVMGTDKTPK